MIYLKIFRPNIDYGFTQVNIESRYLTPEGIRWVEDMAWKNALVRVPKRLYRHCVMAGTVIYACSCEPAKVNRILQSPRASISGNFCIKDPSGHLLYKGPANHCPQELAESAYIYACRPTDTFYINIQEEL